MGVGLLEGSKELHSSKVKTILRSPVTPRTYATRGNSIPRPSGQNNTLPINRTKKSFTANGKGFGENFCNAQIQITEVVMDSSIKAKVCIDEFIAEPPGL